MKRDLAKAKVLPLARSELPSKTETWLMRIQRKERPVTKMNRNIKLSSFPI